MNPQMQARLDLVCKDAAEKFGTTTDIAQLFIATELFRVKLLVLGEQVQDKRMDVKATTRDMAQELTMHLIAACAFPVPMWDAKKTVEVSNFVAGRIMPIVSFFYFGVAPADKEELTQQKIIVPN